MNCPKCGKDNVVAVTTGNGFGSWSCNACGASGSYPAEVPARHSIWMPILAVVALLAGLFAVGRVARGDEFLDRVKALEAKNAAAKTPDPFGHGNHASKKCTCTPDCQCWSGEDCGADCAFRKPPQKAAKADSRCGCGNPGVCSARGCGGTQKCDDESCPHAAKNAASGTCRCGTYCLCSRGDCGDDSCPHRAEGSTRAASDGGADWTWTNAGGGYYWRYAAAPANNPAPFYSVPPRAVPAYSPAPAFFRGGGGFSRGCGSGG